MLIHSWWMAWKSITIEILIIRFSWASRRTIVSSPQPVFRECCLKPYLWRKETRLGNHTQMHDWVPLLFPDSQAPSEPCAYFTSEWPKCSDYKASWFGIKDVVLTGGEIRWAKESLPDICSQLKSKGITYSFSTSFIQEKDFVNSLIALSPRALNISLDPKGTESQVIYDTHIKHIEDVLSKCRSVNLEVKATGVITREALVNCDIYVGLLDKLVKKHPIWHQFI